MGPNSDWYSQLNRAPFSPPDWLFGPAWTVLYAMMAAAVIIIALKGVATPGVKPALVAFGIQFVLNMAWTPAFFGLQNPALAMGIIVALWIAIAACIALFYPISRLAAGLMIPYILWVSFASALNWYIVTHN